ncbi:MAG: hypothetical protein PHN99_03360 [Eubacteriales bacterium]|nr:hypothetical protein [Eubacteriales bacterium]MDD4327390.1 hypothetical protein [Eubacteriales bacterium]MDD4717135.1 hypothetical protein [Eubacteriales bacterium]NCU26002.1 hypothetical protein [Candidatus Nomurabacteria bacterium]
MDEYSLNYVHRRIIADATLKSGNGEEKIIAKDAVMNIAGRFFVILCAGKEVFRAPHKKVEAYRMQSGNGMEFIYVSPKKEKQTVRVHFVVDVKTPAWHNETR